MSAGNKHAWRVFWSHTPTWSAGRENTVYCMQIGIRFHIRFWPLIIGKYRNKIKFVFKIWRIFPDRWDPNFRFDLLPNFWRITWFARHENIFAQHLRNLSNSKLRYSHNYANKYLIGLIYINNNCAIYCNAVELWMWIWLWIVDLDKHEVSWQREVIVRLGWNYKNDVLKHIKKSWKDNDRCGINRCNFWDT